MDIVFLINALLKKKWVIIICTLAGLLGGLIFVLTKEDYYLSAAQYSTGFTMKQQVKLKDESGLNFLEIDQRFKNVIETFKSPVVIGMLSYELMLHDMEDKRPYRVLTETEKEKPAYKNTNLETTRKLLRSKLNNQELLVAYDTIDKKAFELIKLFGYDNESILKFLIVDRVQGTDYLTILFRSENPELSAYVVNTIGKKFYNFFTKINSERTGESIVKLDSLTRAKKDEYDRSVNALQLFREKVGSPNVGDRAKGAMELLNTLTKQQNDNEAKMNDLKGQLNSVKAQLQDIGNAPTSSSSNAEIASLYQKNRELARTLADKGGADATIQNQIDANVKRIQLLEPSIKSNNKSDAAKRKDELIRKKIDLEFDITSLQSTISSVQSKIGLYSSLSNVGGGDEVTKQTLQNEVDRLNTEYQTLVSRTSAAQDVNVAPDINFKQTLYGQPATKPEPAKRKTILLLSTISAFILSSLIILISDFLNSSLRAPSIFQRNIKVPLLSSINKINIKNNNLESLFLADQQSKNNSSTSDNIFISNIRKLRFEIEKSNKKIILFTSTKAGQGKSTIIEALAQSFSLIKKKVLIIDTNFSNNSLTEKYQAKPLLNQFSFGTDKNPIDKFSSITSVTNIPNVAIVGCNKVDSSPYEILPKNNLLENLSLISNEFDYIFLEGAALNEFADSKELSIYAEGIIAVFAASLTLNHQDKESIDFLNSDDKKLIGGVLNLVDIENLEL